MKVLLFLLLLILMHLRLNLITLRLYILTYLDLLFGSYVVVIPFEWLPVSSLEGSVTALIGRAFLIHRKGLLLTRVKLFTS